MQGIEQVDRGKHGKFYGMAKNWITKKDICERLEHIDMNIILMGVRLQKDGFIYVIKVSFLYT